MCVMPERGRERPPWGPVRCAIDGAPRPKPARLAERHAGRSRHPRRWWRAVAVALLAAGLILCHGCHSGDHDDELIVWLLDR